LRSSCSRRFLLADSGDRYADTYFCDEWLSSQRLDPLTTLREKEYAFFAGDGFPAMLAAHGVALA